MATMGYDKLLEVTDSRYRLSVIVAKRAVQLKKGFPSTLSPNEYPQHRNAATKDVISIAIKEVLLGKDLVWGKDLPSDAELMQANATKMNKEHNQNHYSISLGEPSEEKLFGDTYKPVVVGAAKNKNLLYNPL